MISNKTSGNKNILRLSCLNCLNYGVHQNCLLGNNIYNQTSKKFTERRPFLIMITDYHFLLDLHQVAMQRTCVMNVRRTRSWNSTPVQLTPQYSANQPETTHRTKLRDFPTLNHVLLVRCHGGQISLTAELRAKTVHCTSSLDLKNQLSRQQSRFGSLGKLTRHSLTSS